MAGGGGKWREVKSAPLVTADPPTPFVCIVFESIRPLCAHYLRNIWDQFCPLLPVSKDVVWCRFEDYEEAIEELFPVTEEKN